MRIAREENFDPVLTVIAYEDEDDAVRIANDYDYGLTGSVYTADTDRGLEVAVRVRPGTFGVKQDYTMDPFAPSGCQSQRIRTRVGREGIDGFTDSKSISVAGGHIPASVAGGHIPASVGVEHLGDAEIRVVDHLTPR
ncbi:acyl-CoA reductase-like NAD-dependent aldehyde dehydrogenase [Mycobacterium sp. URHB0021]|jgi:aldehyde dehydrogenase (NAD+)